MELMRATKTHRAETHIYISAQVTSSRGRTHSGIEMLGNTRTHRCFSFPKQTPKLVELAGKLVFLVLKYTRDPDPVM